MKLILFDIDGTLISAGLAPRRAFEKAFEECFSCAPKTEGVKTQGVTDPNIRRSVALATFGRDLSASEYRALNGRYVELLELEIQMEPHYRVLPGIEALLLALKSSPDVLLGLQTGNIEPAVRPKLRRGGLEGFFLLGGFGTDSSERDQIVAAAIARASALLPHDVSLSEVVVIGDTPHDIQAGKMVNATTFGVATGIYSVADLEAEGPHRVFADLSDTREVLRQLVGGKR